MDKLKFKKGDIIRSKRKGKKGHRFHKVLSVIQECPDNIYVVYSFKSKETITMRARTGRQKYKLVEGATEETIGLLYG